MARQAAQTPKGRLRIDPVRHEHQATSTPQPGNGEVLQGELLEALLEGMGLGDMQPVPQFDKENMRQLGQMLSMFSQGTVALLFAFDPQTRRQSRYDHGTGRRQ